MQTEILLPLFQGLLTARRETLRADGLFDSLACIASCIICRFLRVPCRLGLAGERPLKPQQIVRGLIVEVFADAMLWYCLLLAVRGRLVEDKSVWVLGSE